jgi:hypothetical protein
MGSAGVDTIILLGQDRSVTLDTPRQSIVGLEATPDTARLVDAFLRRRHYTTAFADRAIKAIHDAASLAWDSEESLRVDFLNLANCPDPVYMRPFLDKLRTAPANGATLRYADLLADETYFAYPTRDAVMTMGDIYARLGLRDKAERLYRRAEVPPGRLPDLLSERTMFNRGVVRGEVRLNGKPAAGVRVGLVPAFAVPEAFRSSIAPGIIRPYWLRWVGPKALTNAAGQFRMEDITAGSYRMILSSPAVRALPFSRAVSVENAPGRIFVGFGRKSADVGVIRLRLAPASGPPPARRRPAPLQTVRLGSGRSRESRDRDAAL